jgi:hypothetical protein
MADAENGNREVLAAKLPKDLIEKFWATVPDGVKNQRVLEATCELWINLPEDAIEAGRQSAHRVRRKQQRR